jgi:hypothetical protein
MESGARTSPVHGGASITTPCGRNPALVSQDRSAAIAAGDLLGDGRVEIILPDEDDGANTALLRWNGNGFGRSTSRLGSRVSLSIFWKLG